MADTLVSDFLTIGSSSATEIITSGNWVTTILSITICDNSTNGNTFNLYIDPSGTATEDADGTNTYLYAQQSLPGSSTFEHTDKIILHANDKLYIDMANTNQVCTTVTSLKQTS